MIKQQIDSTTYWKPVNPKGNQPQILIRKTDVETEAPIIWTPDVKSQLLGKDPDAGEDWGQEEKWAEEDETVGWHHQLNGHEFEQAPGDSEDGGVWHGLQFMGSQGARHDLVAEQQ